MKATELKKGMAVYRVELIDLPDRPLYPEVEKRIVVELGGIYAATARVSRKGVQEKNRERLQVHVLARRYEATVEAAIAAARVRMAANVAEAEARLLNVKRLQELLAGEVKVPAWSA